MGTSEKVPIFAWIEREEGIPVPSSQSPHASRYIAAWAKDCLRSERRDKSRLLSYPLLPNTPIGRCYTLLGYAKAETLPMSSTLLNGCLRLSPKYDKISFGVDSMRILGIDPGVATIGFGVVDTDRNRIALVKCGVITTPAHTQLSGRLEQIFRDMADLLDIFKPDAVSVEELFFNTNITTGIAVAHARGVILLACRLAGVEIFEYTPLQVKQSVVGYGRAEKKQVMDMVKRLCNLPAPPKPDDAADAVALALCHARSSTSLLNRGGNNACSTT